MLLEMDGGKQALLCLRDCEAGADLLVSWFDLQSMMTQKENEQTKVERKVEQTDDGR